MKYTSYIIFVLKKDWTPNPKIRQEEYIHARPFAQLEQGEPHLRLEIPAFLIDKRPNNHVMYDTCTYDYKNFSETFPALTKEEIELCGED